MLLALAGTVALVMVVVTSVREARRRLRYESWHLLHLYAYLGAGLALPHQLWTGADFTANAPRPSSGGVCTPSPWPRCSSSGSGAGGPLAAATAWSSATSSTSRRR